MLVLHDSPSADLSHIQAIAKMNEGFGMFDYVSIRDGATQWIGQIVQPNQNISTVGQRLDPTILHGLQLMQLHENVQSVESVQIYDILILNQIANDGQIITARVRPLPGAVVDRLDAEQTSTFLNLVAEKQLDDGTNVVGELLNAENVPLCVDEAKFNYHIMIAGGTGSGKSNAAANFIAQAVRCGKCVIVHDAKPDYTLIDAENSDPRVRSTWELFRPHRLAPAGASNVWRVGFAGACDPERVDEVAGFSASDFNPEMLASLLFMGGSEQNQFEGFATAASHLRETQPDRQFSVSDIIQEVQRRNPNAPNVAAVDQIHELTINAIVRKANQRRKRYPWLDSVGGAVGRRNRLVDSSLGNSRSSGVVRFSLQRVVQQGRIVVVDYSRMDERSYAVILSFFLRECQKYRSRSGEIGIVELVDEAHRIFDNETQHGRSLGSAFERVMREGRSVDHSIILSLQNASQIPPRVMNNLNSKVVMKQNSKGEADAATQTMGREFSAQAMRLGVGHALVSMHESRAVVLAQMAPSPYELVRTDNAGRLPTMRSVPVDDDDDDIPF